MKRASSSILVGLFSLAAGYLGHSFSAQACSCLAPELTRNYAEADRVFRGQVIWSLELGGLQNYYLVRPEKFYKGCFDENSYWEWITTASSSAACGASFSLREQYLFFTDKDSQASWNHSTSSCHGNRVFSSLSDKEQDFLNSRYNCCGEDCGCVDGTQPVNCFADPCEMTEPCDTDKALTCVSNYCGGCNAEFFDVQGALACQPASACESDEDCGVEEYCGAEGLCVEDGLCTKDYECNLPGNNFNKELRCLGYGECSDNRCEYKCGNPKCIDHEGYDFGNCEMIIGFVRVGGQCESVSGCGSLIPGGAPAFASKEECESTCSAKASTFACGKSLRCNLGSQYCLETIPGMAPEPGTEVESDYECKDFDLPCEGVPSCEACLSSDPFGASRCRDNGNGEVRVSIALP